MIREKCLAASPSAEGAEPSEPAEVEDDTDEAPSSSSNKLDEKLEVFLSYSSYLKHETPNLRWGAQPLEVHILDPRP